MAKRSGGRSELPVTLSTPTYPREGRVGLTQVTYVYMEYTPDFHG